MDTNSPWLYLPRIAWTGIDRGGKIQGQFMMSTRYRHMLIRLTYSSRSQETTIPPGYSLDDSEGYRAISMRQLVICSKNREISIKDCKIIGEIQHGLDITGSYSEFSYLLVASRKNTFSSNLNHRTF
ncbi:hypothetical protein EYC84_005507 [Monilinia fructicola]|uniref:Uncharacterized protein n=1 Tax=Monilinia fructicola TaxID=38448 RepID=A0A5M9K564_MONFR|nr:hypothetical protein EYC84_005507 [Monilinia fructicola]